MAIKTYNRGDNTRLTENFRVSEFLCHGTGCCASGKIDEELVQILQKIRTHFGKPVHISSAYRCDTWNKQVGGVSGSYHRYGQAADIKVEGVAPAEVAKFAESIGVKGIGLYETDADGHFVHVDTRLQKSFWYGQAQQKRTTFGGQPAKAGDYTLELRYLKPGCKGGDVRALQILLMGRGFSCGNSGADGVFGNDTHSALCQYQKASCLTADGIAGGETMASLLGAA